jgi:type II secretion system protein N
MDRRRGFLYFASVVSWGVLVAALVLYLYFPYQKAFKIVLQNVVGGGRATVAMEGVRTKALGISATKLRIRLDPNFGPAAPFELSGIDISWNPLSLFKGKFTIDSTASLYDGRLKSTMDGIAFMVPSSPAILLTLQGVNMAKCPEGVFPWFRGLTGTLDGVIRNDTALATPDKQTGTFQFVIKNGEVKDIQIRNSPRLVIPYKQITLEGKTNGARIEMTKILVNSDVILLKGSGSIEAGEVEQSLDINLSYEALSKALPLKGKGVISIRGSQGAPLVTISTSAGQKPADTGKS